MHYDRELIARMLEDAIENAGVTGYDLSHPNAAIQEQIDALRAADNAEGAGTRRLPWKPVGYVNKEALHALPEIYAIILYETHNFERTIPLYVEPRKLIETVKFCIDRATDPMIKAKLQEALQ